MNTESREKLSRSAISASLKAREVFISSDGVFRIM